MKRLCLMLLLINGGLLSWSQTTITLRPTADGSVEQWTNNAGTACTSATCYTEVNETSGSSNCTSSSFVQGAGTNNKSAATSNLTQQWALTVTSIPDNAVIESITVYACQRRAASTNTSGNLRIVLNGATTNCASNQTANATFTERSCAFTSLNVTKNGSTTLQIGNRTTANVGIWNDAVAATVTYHNVVAGGVAAAVSNSPAVTATKTSPKSVAATGTFDTPCCSTLTAAFHSGSTAAYSPEVHFAVTVTGVRGASNRNGSVTAPLFVTTGIAVPRGLHSAGPQTLTMAPTVTAVRSAGGVTAAAQALHYDPPCCVTTGFPLSAHVNFNPVVTTIKTATNIREVSAGLNMNSSASVTALQAACARPSAAGPCGLTTSAHFSPVVTLFVGVPIAAAAHFSPAVTGTRQPNQPQSGAATLHFAPVCQGCKGQFFDGASFTIATSVSGIKGNGKLLSASAHFVAAVTTKLGSNRPIAQSLSFASTPTHLGSSTVPLSQGLGVFTSISVAGPSPSNKTVNVVLPVFTISATALESAQSSTNRVQNYHIGNVATVSLGLSKPAAQAAHFAASATAVGAPPRKKIAIIVAN